MAAGVTVSAVFLWLSLRHVDMDGLRRALYAIKIWWLAGCTVCLGVGIVLRSIRWRMILGRPATEQRAFFRATTLGLFSNMIFPARAGEFIRVYMLSRLTGAALPGPIASALIDRLTDLVILLACAGIVYLFTPVGDFIGQWLITLVAVAGVLAAVICAYAWSTGQIETVAGRLFVRWLQPWQERSAVFLTDLRLTFRSLIPGLFCGKLPGLILLIPVVDFIAISFLLQTFQLSLPFAAPLVLWVFLAAGSALPSAPGYVGVYQLAAVWALSFYDVSGSTAVMAATVFQLNVLAVAMLCLFLSGRSLS
jgi:glycosyltransferase 2 family protein